jgi:hypothetical protein
MQLRTGILLSLSLVPALAYAHGGGLNAEGCHNNRKTGDYHCHRAPAATSKAQQLVPSPGAGQVQQSSALPAADRPTCHVGPRGGTYTITKGGRKNYSGC